MSPSHRTHPTISRSAPAAVELTGSRVTGYAARFDQLSNDLGGFVERVDPRTFDKTLRETNEKNDIYALYNHDASEPLARTSDGSLELTADKVGLFMSFDIPDTPTGEKVHRELDAGLLGGSSFAGRLISDVWQERANPVLHIVHEVALRDVGPVTFPAYPETGATVRSLDDLDPLLRDLAISRSLDLDAVVDAIHDGTLGAILSEERIARQDDTPHQGRRRFAHLL